MNRRLVSKSAFELTCDAYCLVEIDLLVPYFTLMRKLLNAKEIGINITVAFAVESALVQVDNSPKNGVLAVPHIRNAAIICKAIAESDGRNHAAPPLG